MKIPKTQQPQRPDLCHGGPFILTRRTVRDAGAACLPLQFQRSGCAGTLLLSVKDVDAAATTPPQTCATPHLSTTMSSATAVPTAATVALGTLNCRLRRTSVSVMKPGSLSLCLLNVHTCRARQPNPMENISRPTSFSSVQVGPMADQTVGVGQLDGSEHGSTMT